MRTDIISFLYNFVTEYEKIPHQSFPMVGIYPTNFDHTDLIYNIYYDVDMFAIDKKATNQAIFRAQKYQQNRRTILS